MTEPFGKFKHKHGKGSDCEHVPLAAINSYAGGALLTSSVVDDAGMSTVE